MRVRLMTLAVVCSLVVVVPLCAQVQGAWANTGTPSSALYYTVQVRLANGNVLIAGGTDGTNYFTAAQVYNPGKGTWSATGSMASGRAEFAAVVLPSGKVLVEGGTGAGSAIFASAELYDPATNRTYRKNRMRVREILISSQGINKGGCLKRINGMIARYSPWSSQPSVRQLPYPAIHLI